MPRIIAIVIVAITLYSLVQLPMFQVQGHTRQRPQRTANRRNRRLPPWPPRCSPIPPSKECPRGMECIDRKCVATERASTQARQAENSTSRNSLVLDLFDNLRVSDWIHVTRVLHTATHWVPWNRGRSGIPEDAVEIGPDKGRSGDPVTYVCRADLAGMGTLPGKVVAGRCNVAWGRREYALDTYEVAVSTVGCWGWPKSSWGDWLTAGQWTVCRTYYRADRGFHIGGDIQTDYGWQGGRLDGHSCTFGWDGGSRTVVLPEVYYPTCPIELRRPPGNSGSTTNPGYPKIASVTITPSRITAGAQATLTVTLDRPAPAGGFVVGISHVTNTGVDDVIVNMPVSLSFVEGATSFPFVIETRRRTNRQTHILFIAFHFSDQKSANIYIDP